MGPLELTEGWRVTIFLALIHILLFGLGLPVLVLQFVGREEIRRVAAADRSPVDYWLPRALIGVVAFTAISLLWRGDLPPTLVRVATSASVTSIIVFTVVYWWRIPRRFSFASVLSGLSARLCECAATDSQDLGALLEDLISLAQGSQSDAELRGCFRVLMSVSDALTTQSTYSGDALGDVIAATSKMTRAKASELTSGAESVIDTLTYLERCIDRSNRSLPTDRRRLALKWFELGVERLESEESNDAAAVYVQGFSDDVLLLFRFGTAALEHGSDLTCLTALTNMERFAQETDDAQHLWIGLACQFASTSMAHSLFVRRRILGPTLEDHNADMLESAQVYFQSTGHRFGIADAVADMRRAIAGDTTSDPTKLLDFSEQVPT